MKKVNFKKVLMALVAVFSLMVFGVEQLEAQAINEFSTGLYDPAPGTFLGTDEAVSVLTDITSSYKEDLGTLMPGNPVYQNVLKYYIYYDGIITELDNGKSVSAAIGAGLTALDDSNGFGSLARAELKELRDGAIDLLQ
ncbi:MAG: hypothetical protein AAFZ15_27165 [Bacteroidota bacterium]